MKKFIPYKKLSKRKQREADGARRQGWGQISPVTRTTPDPKAYDRAKARRWRNDNSESGLFDWVLAMTITFCKSALSGRLAVCKQTNLLEL
ncbi:MAG: hypothetical protein FWF44_11085 [Defluviitaleaceae bacterium]|nr:hypothetical protein [Defluviitaleaceae bacterium]